MEAELLFRWLGVAGIELTVADHVLLIDPFLTRPSFRKMWFGRVEPDHRLVAQTIERCDHILVTHAHWDHLMDVPDVAHNTGAAVCGSANTCRLLRVCGVPPAQIQEVRPGDRFRSGPFEIRVLPAEHIRVPGFAPGPLPPNLRLPLRLRDYRMDRCYSYLIEVDGMRLLDWSGASPQLAPPAQVLFVGADPVRAPHQALLNRIRPELVIPVHWDDLFRPLSRPVRPFLRPPRLAFPPLGRMDLTGFAQQVKYALPQVCVLIPEPLRRYDLRRTCPSLQDRGSLGETGCA